MCRVSMGLEPMEAQLSGSFHPYASVSIFGLWELQAFPKAPCVASPRLAAGAELLPRVYARAWQ